MWSAEGRIKEFVKQEFYSALCTRKGPYLSLDRGLGYEPRRREFESLRARMVYKRGFSANENLSVVK